MPMISLEEFRTKNRLLITINLIAISTLTPFLAILLLILTRTKKRLNYV